MWKIENISLCEYLDSMCNVVDTEQRYNTSISLYNLCNTGWLFIDTKSFERRWQEHQYSRGKKTKSLFYMNRWNSFRMWYKEVYTDENILSKFVHPSKYFLIHSRNIISFFRLSTSISFVAPYRTYYYIVWICRTHKNNTFFNQKYKVVGWHGKIDINFRKNIIQSEVGLGMKKKLSFFNSKCIFFPMCLSTFMSFSKNDILIQFFSLLELIRSYNLLRKCL